MGGIRKNKPPKNMVLFFSPTRLGRLLVAADARKEKKEIFLGGRTSGARHIEKRRDIPFHGMQSHSAGQDGC
jgi:hypothetical protein